MRASVATWSEPGTRDEQTVRPPPLHGHSEGVPDDPSEWRAGALLDHGGVAGRRLVLFALQKAGQSLSTVGELPVEVALQSGRHLIAAVTCRVAHKMHQAKIFAGHSAVPVTVL